MKKQRTMHISRILSWALMFWILQPLQAAQLLVPMDKSQSNHLKAYGVAYWVLQHGGEISWLLNYRGGSFLLPFSAEIQSECAVRNVAAEVLSDAQVGAIRYEIGDAAANMDEVPLQKAPKIAVYSPKNKLPWDDAVTLVLTYAEIPYDVVYDDEVLSGILPEVSVKNRQIMKAIIDGVRTNGYYEFENGNQIPAYIWTKMIDAKTEYGYRLTTQTPADKKDDPVLFPGWRGQHDDWGSIVPAFADQNMTNVAIKGLFKYIIPGSEEAKALEAEGYVQTNWAIDMLNYEEDYATKLFAGYTDEDYVAKNPPIHLIPNTYQVLLNSGITNGYGFRQQ